MRHMPSIATVAALLALAACTQAPTSNAAADAGGNAAAPATPPPSAPAAPAAPSTQANVTNEAAGNGLWGVAEEEDEASHRGMDFIAFNRTGRIITALSIRPDEGPLEPGAAPDPWTANLLGLPELPDGQRAAARYEPDIEICRWQLRVTFADRKTRDYPAVNLCNTIRVDLR